MLINKISKYQQIPDDNEPFVLNIIWELLLCFKLLDDAFNSSCDENPYIYLFCEDEGQQIFGRAKVCLTNLHLPVSNLPDWRSRVFFHLQIFQRCNWIPPLLSDWYRDFVSSTEEILFNPFLNHLIIPDCWMTIIPVPREAQSSSQTLQCVGFGWSESMWQWAYRFFHPLYYRQKIALELRNIFYLHKLFPRFFTEVLGVACDYYIVPIGPSYGQNITALDNAIHANPILLTRILFDCLLLLHILDSQRLKLNSMNNADLIFMFNQNQPRVQIRNPEIIETSDNSGQGIIQNIQSLKNLVQKLFIAYNDNKPKYLVRNQLINQILDGWDLHHQCFDLIQKYFSCLYLSNWSIFNALDRFGEKSKFYLIILNALTRLNHSSHPRLYFQNATEFRVEDCNLLVNFSDQHTLITNDFLALNELNTDAKIVAYFQDFLTALNLLHRNNIYYMIDFQIHQTVGIREGVAEFHLRNFEDALWTTSFHESNARHDLEAFSNLVGSFLVLKPIRSLYPKLHASLDRLCHILPIFEVSPIADYLSMLNNF